MTDALFVLERMRAIKTPEELKKLKYASEAVIEFDAGGDRQARPRHHQERACSRRCAARRPAAG